MPDPSVLTFDDGPDPRWTPLVLDVLRDVGRRATFFVIGERAARHPALLHRALEAGHDVQLHCHEHVDHTDVDRAFIERDTDRALAVLRGLGVKPSLWRTPWGRHAPWTAQVAAERDLELVGWTADTHDWRGDSASQMLTGVAAGLDDSSVVLMHDGLGPGALRKACGQTVALIELLHVELGRREGAR